MDAHAHFTDYMAASMDLIEMAEPVSKVDMVSENRPTPTLKRQSSKLRRNRISVHLPMHLATQFEQQSDPCSPAAESEQTTDVASEPFLTALAAQERKVLELKEELQRAETHLEKLKSSWAKHEEARKWRDSQHTLHSSRHSVGTPHILDMERSDDTPAMRVQRELERRKAMMQSSKSSTRTTFSGSRHTRALSLLSPTIETAAQPIELQSAPRPPRRESLFEPKKLTAYKASRGQATNRNSQGPLSPNLDLGINLLDTAIDHEMLLRTGKKFATDFKDGLLTFWEDIRQVTVGEEATQPVSPRKSQQTLHAPRKQSSRNSLRSSPSRNSSIAAQGGASSPRPAPAAGHIHTAILPGLADVAFWSEADVVSKSPETVLAAPSSTVDSSSPITTYPSSPKPEPVPEEDNPWDAWDDSPRPSRHSSYAESDSCTAPSTMSVSASPRTSTSTKVDDGRGSLDAGLDVWPDDWEDSLTPITVKGYDDNGSSRSSADRSSASFTKGLASSDCKRD